MFDPLVNELSQRYGLGERGRDLFGLLMAYIHNDRRGGFVGFIEGFREQGHGGLVSSWLGNPDAGGLNASDVGMVFGQGLLNDWSTRLGASRATVAAAIAGVLPRLVAELTPGGRIPGGFAAAPTLDSGAPSHAIAGGAAEAALARDRVAAGVGAGADANGSTSYDSGADHALAGVRAPAINDALPDPGRIVPGDDRRLDAPGLGQPLRRAPASDASPASVRTPVEARRGQDDPSMRETLDPAERRVAEMAAAFDPRRREGQRSPEPADMPSESRSSDGWRPEGWRPAMHPPRRRRGSWLVRLIVLLLLLAAAGWFAWAQGWLDPFIDQLNLPIRSTPATL